MNLQILDPEPRRGRRAPDARNPDARNPDARTPIARPLSPLRRLGAAIGAVGRRPAAAVDLWRLWERSVVDSRTLAAAVVDAIRAWPGSKLPT